MTAPVLICTDLDRTLLPNGPSPESPTARRRFAAVVARPEVSLAYVTGRDLVLVEEAVREYSLPEPRFVVTDVGTAIFSAAGGNWRAWRSWNERLVAEWPAGARDELRDLFADIRDLRPQEASRQGQHKLSYDCEPQAQAEPFLKEMRRRLELRGTAARLIFSRDDEGTGLLDVIPAAAGKLAAIEFLMQKRRFRAERTLFAGDSGNDLEVLASGLPAVLVANATESVRISAHDAALAAGHPERLYLARGGFRGMNGNYSAGILEGLAHFFPETLSWM